MKNERKREKKCGWLDLNSVARSSIYSMRAGVEYSTPAGVEYQELLHGNGPIRLLDSV